MNWPSTPAVAAALTAHEQQRLRFWMWAYVLCADGFTRQQARRLAFQRYWHQVARAPATEPDDDAAPRPLDG